LIIYAFFDLRFVASR